ncbi:MAG: hypothetical protein ACTHMB_24865 [Candidatus Binatia bacterium]
MLLIEVLRNPLEGSTCSVKLIRLFSYRPIVGRSVRFELQLPQYVIKPVPGDIHNLTGGGVSGREMLYDL